MRYAALALALLLPLGAAAQERSETYKKASVGDGFEITLPANPSTGYQWSIDTAASRNLALVTVEDLGTSPQPSKDGQPLVGAPVLHSWLVEPQARGTAHLVLVWRRPWEKEPPEKIHTFNIDIGD
jgi:inhibitor of cysteine peptidase